MESVPALEWAHVFKTCLQAEKIMKNPKKILIRMPNWLGDLVMATPVLADVRKQWPDAEITAMAQANVAPLIAKDPHIDTLFSYQRPSGWVPHQEHWEIIRQLRLGKYDLGILLTNSFSSAWWFFFGGVRKRIGYKGNMRNLLLSQSVPFPARRKEQHLVLTYKMLLEPLGIPLSDTAPQLYISEEEKQGGLLLLKELGIKLGVNRILGINPGAAHGSAKCWLPERFQQVTERMLTDPNLFVLYFGDKAGASLVHKICEQLPPDRVINLAGKTSLRELITLISLCDLLLTNDSGPMHVASALNVPLVALFGSTSDVATGPYNGGIVIHKHVECSPCYKRVCPIDFRCMKRIEVDEVCDALEKQLKVRART